MKFLQLDFEEVGQQVVTEICLGQDYESFPSIIHGGIVSSILDEVMAQAAHRRGQAPAMTVGLRIRFIQPMRTDEAYIARAKFSKQNHTTIEVCGELDSLQHGLTAVAVGTFFLMSADQLSDKKV